MEKKKRITLAELKFDTPYPRSEVDMSHMRQIGSNTFCRYALGNSTQVTFVLVRDYCAYYAFLISHEPEVIAPCLWRVCEEDARAWQRDMGFGLPGIPKQASP